MSVSSSKVNVINDISSEISAPATTPEVSVVAEVVESVKPPTLLYSCRSIRARVPQELKDLPQWMIWSNTWLEKTGTWAKQPRRIEAGVDDKNKPRKRYTACGYKDTLTTLDVAIARVDQVSFLSGVGFALIGTGIVGVDIDGYVPGSEWAEEIISKFEAIGAYMEVSPSGKGVRIFCRGKLAAALSHKFEGEHTAIESWDDGRYVTVTGAPLARDGAKVGKLWAGVGEPERGGRDLPDGQEVLDWLQAKYRKQPLAVEVTAAHKARLATYKPAPGESNDDSDYPWACEILFHGHFDGLVDNYHTWLNVGMALASRFGPHAGADLWDRWSQRGANYQAGVCRSKVGSFKRNDLKFGSFIEWAKQAGAPLQAKNDPSHPDRWKKSAKAQPAASNGLADDAAEVELGAFQAEVETGDTPTEGYAPQGGQRRVRFNWALDGANIRDPAVVADWFATEYRKNGRNLVFWKGELWQFDGSCYVSTEGEKSSFLTEVAYHMNQIYANNEVWDEDEQEYVKLVFCCTARTNIVECIKCAPGARLENAPDTPGFFLYERNRPEWWPSNPAAIVTCRNGMLSLETGDFLPSTWTYFSTTHNDIEWTGADTPAPQFKAWLEGVQPRREGRQQVEWLLGYTLYGDNPLSKLFYVYGVRRTGKGSTIRFMERLVGVSNSTATCLKELGSDFGLESVMGKSLLTYPDYRPTDSGKADLGQATQALLSLTGRDRQNIRRKKKTTVTAILRAKFVMGSNAIISLPDTSGVVASRFHAIGFDVTFADSEVPDLDAKIWADESSGILAAAVGYYKDFVAHGFKFPETEASKEMHENVERSSSPAINFRTDCLVEISPDDGLALKEAFQSFTEYLKDVNARSAGWTENKFRCSLKDLGFKIVKMRVGGGRVEFLTGVGLSTKGTMYLEKAEAAVAHIGNQQELTALNLEDKRLGVYGRTAR